MSRGTALFSWTFRHWMRWGVGPSRLYPRERLDTRCTGSWVGPRAGLDGRKIYIILYHIIYHIISYHNIHIICHIIYHIILFYLIIYKYYTYHCVTIACSIQYSNMRYRFAAYEQ